MRLIFEDDIEKQDFVEIILSPKDYESIEKRPLVKEFSGVFFGKDLNVCIRIEENKEEENDRKV